MHPDQTQQFLSAISAVYGAVLSSAGALEGIPALSWTGVLALAGGIYGYAELRGRLKAREESQDAQLKFIEAGLLRIASQLGVDLSDLKG